MCVRERPSGSTDGVSASVGKGLEEHGLEEAAVAERLDEAVTAAFVLEDFDAAAAGDAVGVDEVEGIVGADMDLVAGLAGSVGEDVEEIKGCGASVHCMMEGLDLVWPSGVS